MHFIQHQQKIEHLREVVVQASKSWLEFVDFEITNLGPEVLDVGYFDTGMPEKILAARFANLPTVDFG